jgi:superfamily II DNA or RNA helicase
MLARITVGYCESILECPDALALDAAKTALTYTNTSEEFKLFRAVNGLKRFRATMRLKERDLIEKHGAVPDWFGPWRDKKLEEMGGQLQEAKARTEVKCYREIDANSIITYTGLVPRVSSVLKEINRVSHTIEDTRCFPEYRGRHFGGNCGSPLRKPQQEAFDTFVNHRHQGLRGNGKFDMPPGLGKTRLAEEFIWYYGQKTLFLVPTLSILRQTVKRFERMFGKNSVQGYGGGKRKLGYVTVATYQSVATAEAQEFDEIRVLLCDEAHLVPSRTFTDARMKVQYAPYCMALTGSDERYDNAELMIEAACGPTIYKYTVQQAIQDEYLARPSFTIYEVFDTRGTYLKLREGKEPERMDAEPYDGKDELLAYRNWLVGNDPLNEFIVEMSRIEVEAGGSVMILVDEKQHADRLLELMPEAGYAKGAAAKQNEKLQKDYNDRRLKILIGTSAVGIGTDFVPTTLQFDLMDTSGGANTKQANGRAMRNDPDENGVPRKPTVRIVTFDFPESPVLSRHTKAREAVYRQVGEVERRKLF